jgi:exonuclease III
MHKNNEKAQNQTHFMMEQLDLVDSFREFNPAIKRYTWRGPAKNKLG